MDLVALAGLYVPILPFYQSLIVSKPFFCRKSEPGKEVTGSGKSHE